MRVKGYSNKGGMVDIDICVMAYGGLDVCEMLYI